jgi:two-component system CAI-1 autoinducer sensor kinase/phosphatase CqsS
LLFNVAQHHQGPTGAEIHDMRAVIERALERYHYKPGQRDLLKLDLDQSFEFRGSDLLMSHVLFNLLKNGFRAIEARGSDNNHVAISLTRTPEWNLLTVTDTGTGVPPELLEYIFIPFVSGQSPGAGAGLGLSFCRMVVEGSGGTIACHSPPGGGTTFTIRLPKRSAEIDAELA